MIAKMGALSVGLAAPQVSKGDVLASPFQVDKKRIETDILIVGGGTAGVVAAIQAARAGVRTTLIESGSQLGGTTTTGGVSFPGIFHAWGKQIVGGIGWELVMEAVKLNDDILPNFSIIPNNTTIRHWRHQVTVNGALYALIAEEKCVESGLRIHYYESPTAITFEKGKWTVTTVGKGISREIICNQLIDCSGNAAAASIAGFPLLREEDTQPGSFIFRLGGYNFDSLDLTKIPREYHNRLRQNMLIGDEVKVESSVNNFPPTVPYNYVYVHGADSSTAELHTEANLTGRSELLSLIRKLRTFPGCEKLKLIHAQPETAVRETFRIDGLYQLTHEDYVSGKVFEDSLSYSFYPIDLHRNGESIYQEFLKEGVVATIPLRALIPKNSRNFLVAGRCLSSDRLANSALRVQASCMGMGQAAAAAAVLAVRHQVTPADVPLKELKSLLREHGGIVPGA
nr:FAD-dependent oxidoreductase [Lunatimonas sp.]